MLFGGAPQWLAQAKCENGEDQPGAAVAKNGTRQPNLAASKPPPAKPAAMPNAVPADQIAITRPRRWRGK